MSLISITGAKTNINKPYTLSLSGYIGQTKFKGDLEGVNLRINSICPLEQEQINDLEERLRKIFSAPYGGRFKQKEIDEIMKRSPIQFEV